MEENWVVPASTMLSLFCTRPKRVVDFLEELLRLGCSDSMQKVWLPG